jgi:hypothetical protein
VESAVNEWSPIPMADVTVFCVQTYCRASGRLELGALRQFTSAVQAEDAASALRPLVAGVVIYEVTGDPEFDNWGEPELFAAFGEVPRLAA